MDPQLIRSIALNNAVVIDGSELDVRLFEDALKPGVMVHVRMRDHGGIEGPLRLEAGITPAQVPQHVVGDAGIHDDVPVVRRDQEAAITLADVQEDDFEAALGLEIGFLHPAFGAAGGDGHPTILCVAGQLDPVTPEEFAEIGLSTLGLEHRRSGIAGKHVIRGRHNQRFVGLETVYELEAVAASVFVSFAGRHTRGLLVAL